MSKYVIGIDLGINNVGWSIADFETKKIEKSGVRLFTASDSAETRRGFRAARRLKKRKDNRVKDLLKLFETIDFPCKNTVDSNLIDKRVIGLNSKLEKEDIVNICCYIATHRGYIPFGDEDRELVDLKGLYPCEYYKNLLDSKGKYRALEQVVDNKELIKELKKIIEVQTKYYSELLNIQEEIITIINRKRKFWEGPGSTNSLTPYGRFKSEEDVTNYKSSGEEKYLYDELVGKCSIYPNEKTVSVANYYYELFNLLNDFINTSVTNIEDVIEQSYFKLDKKNNVYKLNTKGLEAIIDYCKNHISLKYTNIYKDLFNLKKDDLVGYRIDKSGKPQFSTLNTYRDVLSIFEGYNNEWIYDINQYNEVIRILTVSPGIVETKNMISTSSVINYEFNDDEYNLIKILSDKLKKNNVLRYGSLSEKALTRSINDMLSLELNFQQVSKLNDYEKEYRKMVISKYPENDGMLLMSDLFVDDIIASPQVKKSLRQAIKVINGIILEKKEYPYVIAVESTKEMNGHDRVLEINREQKLNEDYRKEAIDLFSKEFGDNFVSESNILKTMLFNELDGRCPYCNKPFKDGLNGIISGSIEVEHILPLSKSYDDSYNNKTLSCRECNSSKGNKTPYQWLQKDLYEDLVSRISKLKISDDKKLHFMETSDLDKYNIRFFNRNLRDTAYGTKELINQIHLFNYVIENKLNDTDKINTLSTPGQLTSKFRNRLDIVKNRDEGKYHHAVDASIVASIALDDKLGTLLLDSQNDSKFWIMKKDKINNVDKLIYNFDLSFIANDIKNIKCDDDIFISNQVSKDVNKSIANANVYKFIKINDEFYKVDQINNIYDARLLEDKTVLSIFKGENKFSLMLKDNNPKMYNKLLEIYDNYKSKGPSKNPFVNYCLEVNDIDIKDFNYLIHGIKQENGPVIKKLRYYSKVSSPNLLEKKNINKKDNTYLGLYSVGQAYIKLYWDLEKEKFIFMPIYLTSIDLKTKKVNKNDKTYLYFYNKFLEGKKYKFICDLYNGNYLKVEKKDSIVEGSFSSYDVSNNIIKLNDTNRSCISCSDKKISVIDTDILGNKKIRLTWPNN